MLTVALSLAAALLLTGLVIPVLTRAQVMDVPNGRSSHTSPVPRGGGLAVMGAVTLGSAYHVLQGGEVAWIALLVSVALAAVGFVDDRRSLPSSVRLAAQVGAGLVIALWALETGDAGWWAPAFVAVSTIVVVGYVNAYNFMDGVNGISALTAAIAGGWWFWLGWEQDLPALHGMGAALTGAVVGFLPWNAPRARIFLGDVGSYGLGCAIASMTVLGWAAGVSAYLVVAPLLVYVADTGWALIKRALGGRALMEAHREHVYQQLVDRGWSHLASAALCAGVSAVACLLLATTTSLAGLVAACSLVIAYLATPAVLGRNVGK